VCPEVFLDQGLGRLFVSRVPGNVASDGAKWMIEIAVSEFKVPLLAVIGHTGCLAVSQVVQGETGGSGALLKIGILSSMYEASAKHPEDIGRATVIENARHTIRQLATESHTLRQALHANAITCVAMLYNMDEGSVALIDEPLSNPL
jgi:carbonic anhydrase